jgi:hypothetical protein
MYEVSLYKSFQWFSNFTPNFDLFEGLDSLESEEIMFRRKNTPLFNESDAEQREAKVLFKMFLLLRGTIIMQSK